MAREACMAGEGAYVQFTDRQEVLTEHCTARQMCGWGGDGVAVVVVQYRGQSYVCVNKRWLTIERQREQSRALEQAS